MRRIVVIFCLLLFGCQGTEPPGTTASPDATATVSASPTSAPDSSGERPALSQELEIAVLNIKTPEKAELIKKAIEENPAMARAETKYDTLFHLIVASDPESPLLTLLLENGVDVNETDKIGRSALHKVRKTEACKFLLEKGADPNLATADVGQGPTVAPPGRTPLMEVATRNGPDTAEILGLLIEAKADVNAVDSRGQTALHLGCQSPEYVKILLEHKADPNIKDNRGDTPLLFAVATAYGNETEGDVVKMLVDAGASLDAKNKDGKTALNLATEKNWEKGLATLKALGAK